MPSDSDLARLGNEVEAYARPRVGADDAPDVRQDVLLKVVLNSDRLRPGDEGRWANRVAVTTVVDVLRGRSRRALPTSQIPDSPAYGVNPERIVVRREDVRIALLALDTLPPDQAALLWDVHVQGLTRSELTEKYSVGHAALQSRLTRARAALKKQFVAHGGSLGVFGTLFPALGRTGRMPYLGLTPGAALIGGVAAITIPFIVGLPDRPVEQKPQRVAVGDERSREAVTLTSRDVLSLRTSRPAVAVRVDAPAAPANASLSPGRKGSISYVGCTRTAAFKLCDLDEHHEPSTEPHYYLHNTTPLPTLFPGSPVRTGVSAGGEQWGAVCHAAAVNPVTTCTVEQGEPEHH